MHPSDQYFTKEAAEMLRQAIAESGGREVFCVGMLDGARKVSSIRVVGRGNDASVPAVLEAARFGMVAIHNHPSSAGSTSDTADPSDSGSRPILTPSDQDVVMAGEFGAGGVASYIVDNDVRWVYALVEPFDPVEIKTLQPAELVELFHEHGRIARSFPGFESRPQQITMVEDVTAVFNNEKVGLIEAGTGVGKSLAYLVPAVHWALTNKQKVVLSTNTINLQEQLMQKDIPFLRENLGVDFSATLLKGRNNYLCLRRAYDLKRDAGQAATAVEKWETDLIFEWMEQTADGSKAELNVIPSREAWELVCCERDNCRYARCAHFGRCFFHQSRRQAARSNLIVANHHLLMADLSIREQSGQRAGGILPAFHKLVIDEAHHLEEVATSYLGLNLTPMGLYRNLGRMQHTRHKERGLVPLISTRLYNLITSNSQSHVARLHQFIDQKFLPARKTCQEELQSTFTRLIKDILAHENRTLGQGEEYKKRISEPVLASSLWSEILHPGASELASILSRFLTLGRKLSQMLFALNEHDPEVFLALESRIYDLESVVLRLKVHLSNLEEFLEESPDDCRWIEIGHRRGDYSISFRRAPLDVSGRLRTLMFETYDSVLLTSATLSINASFTFLKKRIGLDQLPGDRLLERVLDSPFDYANRVLLGLPADMPDPGSRSYVASFSDLVEDALDVTGGSTFVLFTSYGMLSAVHDRLENSLILKRFYILRQGRVNRHQLLEEFRKNPRSVLFATDSFWEGVDVKGDSLQCVIIAKLPFQVPTEPIIEARMEKIRLTGGSPFQEFSLPNAIIKFKQGFGRLIRSRDDWGMVLVADPRITSKSYGRQFLHSLPPCRVRQLKPRELKEELGRFREHFVSPPEKPSSPR